jgi:hypothetical protein
MRLIAYDLANAAVGVTIVPQSTDFIMSMTDAVGNRVSSITGAGVGDFVELFCPKEGIWVPLALYHGTGWADIN